MQINDHLNFSKELITCYSQTGFGGMTKNDFEVLIFHLLRKHGSLKNKSNFNSSILLKIPEAKVKRLAYEAELKYSSYNEHQIINRFFKLIKKSKFKAENKKIQFVIEDKFLRTSISSFLKNLGHFADTSFNSEIISIDIDSLVALLENYLPKDEIDEIVSQCRSLIKSEKGDKLTFKLLMNKYFEGLATKSGENSADLLFEVFSVGTNTVKRIVNLFKDHFLSL
jgi:hypothetical protein